MSNFAERQAGRERERSRNSERRNTLGKFFYNLALACFTVMVLGNAAPAIGIAEEADDSLPTFLLGSAVTIVLAYMANKVMK